MPITIPAPDLEKAKSFYSEVFNWRVQENIPGEKYWFFESGNVGGAFDGSGTPSAKAVILTLRVSDIQAAITRISDLGGIVVRGRSRIGEASPGHDAYFLDPNGNQMGLYQEA